MCGVGVIVAAVGAITFLVGTAHAVLPDLGQDDEISRIGIGIARIADGVLQIIDEDQRDADEAYCRDIYEDDIDDVEECIEERAAGIEAIRQGLQEAESELDRQTRNSAVGALLRGLLIHAAGMLIFMFHARRTELFATPPTPPPATLDSAA